MVAALRLSLIALCLAACSADGLEPPAPTPDAAPVDPCGGTCSNVELCVPDPVQATVFSCARICANQFHCWSGCCLPTGTAGYNVCRDTNQCFAPK